LFFPILLLVADRTLVQSKGGNGQRTCPKQSQDLNTFNCLCCQPLLGLPGLAPCPAGFPAKVLLPKKRNFYDAIGQTAKKMLLLLIMKTGNGER
jgi:hypothetical protein